MGDIVNLNRVRKAANRAAEETAAVENRRKFGRTKAEKLADKARKTKAEKDIDGHKREP